jgi:hypothetical protein
MAKNLDTLSVVVPNGSSSPVKSGLISQNSGVHNGLIELIKVNVPNFTAAITITLALYDTNGILKWSLAAIAKNAIATIIPSVTLGAVTYPWKIPICGKEYWQVTPSGDPTGSGGTVVIDAEYSPDAFEKLS